MSSRLHSLVLALHRHLPSQCLLCGRWPSRPLCSDCLAQHAAARSRCAQCALPLPMSPSDAPRPEGPRRCATCLLRPPPWSRSWATVDYASPWRELIAAFKFHHQPELAHALAGLMREQAGLQEAVQQADLVVPIPVSASTYRDRGYNQSALLARGLNAKRVRELLVRHDDHVVQHRLSRHQRHAHMRRALALMPGVDLRGQRVLLVDDVMTTGATLAAASHCLLQAGATHVDVAVLARTPPTRVRSDDNRGTPLPA